MSEKVINPDVLSTGQEPDKDRIVSRETKRQARRLADSEKAAAKYQAELAREAAREAERQTQGDGMQWLEGLDTDGAHRFAALVDQKKDAVKSSRVTPRPSHADVLRKVQNAERQAGDGTEISGTGYTILKMRQKPLERLIEAGKIGMEEIQAAEEIFRAFMDISRRVGSKSPSWERVDSGGVGEDMHAVLLKPHVKRFQAWARHWTRANERSDDPMFEVIISAVVDERLIAGIALDVQRRRHTVELGLIAGLRDYAARTGMVTSGKAQRWMAEAARTFTPMPAELAKAIHRARVEV